MKKLCSILFIYLIISNLQVFPQNINRLEYFIDTDPGFGLGQAVTITPNPNITNLTFNVSLDNISNGFHTLYLRGKDANNNWSTVNYQIFLKENVASILNINKLEYFIDTDPGLGQAIDVPITASASLSNFAFSVNLSAVSEGFHTLYVRGRDAGGNWSMVNYQIFLKENVASILNINKLEYFIDTDPGLGQAIDVPITASASLSNFAFSVNLSAVSEGLHTLYVRARDANNNWSTVNYRIFLKESVSTTLNINKLEYFIDTDPGLGQGTDVSITAGASLSNFTFSVNLSPVTEGFHTLYVRGRDAGGNWSMVNYRTFIKEAVSITPNLVAGEWYVAPLTSPPAAPAYGSGIVIPNFPTNQTSASNFAFNANLSQVSGITFVDGQKYNLFVRARDANNRWSTVAYREFTYCSFPAPVALAPNELTDVRARVRWNAVSNATAYRLDVSTDNFNTFVRIGNTTFRDLAINKDSTTRVITGLDFNTTYQFRLQAVGSACTSPTSNVITFKTLLGIPTNVEDNALARATKVFPNPSTNKFTVSIEGIILEKVKYQITNTWGKNVQKAEIEQFGSHSKHILDLSAYPAGVYFLELTTQEGKKVIKRLIKQ
jgi:hypothetical protein